MLHCYGENSFTFLLFQELNKSTELVEKFLSNLKSFNNGKNFILKKDDNTNNEEPQIWLFPNFGKPHGFGEPDAILLYGNHVFWFEVETGFDLKKRRSSARVALIQLFRFHYFSRVLAAGRTRRTDLGNNHWAWMGPTISGKGTVKDAILRIAGHKVLQQIEPQLIDAAQNTHDHYVLLTDGEPQHITEKTNEISLLHTFFDQTVEEVDSAMIEWSEEAGSELIPSKPNIQHFWYQYYRGDLNQNKVNIESDKIKYESISFSQTKSKKKQVKK